MLGANGTVDPLFADMPCTLHSFAAPGESTCMEFDDGKILLSSDCTLPEDAWTLVERTTGNRAQELLTENDLLAGERLLNGEQALPEIARKLRAQYAVDEVIVHTIRQTLLVTPWGITVQDTRFVENPRISTGAGDNFNGASCTALLLGLCDAERVEFANDFAHYCVKNGVNPSFAQLIIQK